MILRIIFDTDENPKDVNELQIAAAVEDICRQIPNVDIDTVGYMLQTQAAVDRLKYESMMNRPCQAVKEEV